MSTVNVRYMVDDVETAVAFYTTHLSFTVISKTLPAFADVARGDLRLLLSGPSSSAGRSMPDGRRPVHSTLLAHDIPIVDKASLLLMANNELMLDLLEAGEYERAKSLVGWMLWSAKTYGIKAVNPGGVAAWKIVEMWFVLRVFARKEKSAAMPSQPPSQPTTSSAS